MAHILLFCVSFNCETEDATMSGEAEENCYSGASNFLLHDQHLHHAASLSTTGHGQGKC